MKNTCENVLKITYLKPEIDCKTRWTSLLSMLKNYSYLAPALNYIGITNLKIKRLLLNEDENKEIEIIIKFLQDIESASTYLGTNLSPKISEELLIFHSLKLLLTDYRNNGETIRIKNIAMKMSEKMDEVI